MVFSNRFIVLWITLTTIKHAPRWKTSYNIKWRKFSSWIKQIESMTEWSWGNDSSRVSVLEKGVEKLSRYKERKIKVIEKLLPSLEYILACRGPSQKLLIAKMKMTSAFAGIWKANFGTNNIYGKAITKSTVIVKIHSQQKQHTRNKAMMKNSDSTNILLRKKMLIFWILKVLLVKRLTV